MVVSRPHPRADSYINSPPTGHKCSSGGGGALYWLFEHVTTTTMMTMTDRHIASADVPKDPQRNVRGKRSRYKGTRPTFGGGGEGGGVYEFEVILDFRTATAAATFYMIYRRAKLLFFPQT